MTILALDIGGANIKAVHRDDVALSRAFALWREPNRLANMLMCISNELPKFEQIAFTMTAELCDCFATKREGVSHVLDAVEQLASGRPIHVWQTDGQFVSPPEARRQPMKCAAANWHALATFVAGLYPKNRGLLIDTGSTTTDVIAHGNGHVMVQGKTDTERLATGELVYAGAWRTPLMALGPMVSWNGHEHAVMAELFATTADVFLLLGDWTENPDNPDTADGKPFTVRAATARVLRMIGADLEIMSEHAARCLAKAFADSLLRRLACAANQVCEAAEIDLQHVMVSGSGAFIAERAAKLACPHVPIVRLADRIGEEAANAACAHALVQLLM